ncbi:MAG TPA: hypothetical protein VMP11_08100 [Verrucomicrobiae bacterium]|nr:hypothetical protein [Verrucomicrobiae bacterium]
MTSTSRESDRRVLVLGCEPFTRLVTAYPWDKLPPLLNVADYDVVFLNLVPFLNEKFANGIRVDTLPSWDQFARLIFSKGSEIIVIGHPGPRLGSNADCAVTWWLPCVPEFTYEIGQEIRDIEPEFEYYFRNVREWSFYASREVHPNSFDTEVYAQRIHSAANDLRAGLRPLARTRFHRAIAFELNFEISKVYHPRNPYINDPARRQRLALSGRLVWLPPPTEISETEAVELILRERFGFRVEVAAPTWVGQFVLPREAPLRSEIARLVEELKQHQMGLVDVRKRAAHESRFRKLLYEQGEDVLEPVARDALRELEAKVDDPLKKGREDGRLIDPRGRRAILEIKGRTGTLRLDDVRQLRQWADDAVVNEAWTGKGILIANLCCGEPLERRRDLFPDNCKKVAEQFNLCLMTTTQLFHALCEHQEGRLDLPKFWDSIFSTSGVSALPELSRP